MPAEIPNVRLRLASKPESVVVVRQVIAGLADVIGLGALELNEVNTAVSEASNNVVLHAYGGEEGPLEVDMCCRRGGLCVGVRDHGRGTRCAGRTRTTACAERSSNPRRRRPIQPPWRSRPSRWRGLWSRAC
jgi:anti-sigma regulatory factor (Ser/Thr protein kinase)